MSSDLDAFKKTVEQQKDEILDYLSHLGMADEYDYQIADPDPESPLGEVLLAVRVVADNLALLARQRDASFAVARHSNRSVSSNVGF